MEQQMKALEHFGTADGRLKMLQFSVVDAENWFAVIDRNREHFSQYGDETSNKYPTLASVLVSILTPNIPNRLRFGIWVGHTLTGSINLTPVMRGMASVGYLVGKEYCGQHIASDALYATIAYARKEKSWTTLIATTHKDNKVSQRILKHAGFEEKGGVEDEIHWSLQNK
jgi:RimJ/RimL family protein N-acetyltransferase